MRNPVISTLREIAQAARHLDGTRSLARYSVDAILYRLMRFVRLPARPRNISLTGGVSLTYRLNRGDILTLNEVWFSEVYRPAFALGRLATVVDLGANIGLTSVFLARHFGASVLAVEPLASNVALARRNFHANGVRGEVLQAAVGAADGTAFFSAHRDFNSGRVTDQGDLVDVFSMPSLLARLPQDQHVDLLKVDIEGAEQALFSGDLCWLDRVQALIIEFHPQRADPTPLVTAIVQRGFRYIPPHSEAGGQLDSFLREFPPSARR